MHSLTIRERRRRAAKWFWARVLLLTLVIGGVAYSAWFSPWARAPHAVVVETLR